MTVDATRASGPPAADVVGPIRVIFVCTGNSARSQMAEALLRQDGGDRFEVVSAGVSPRGVHPMTIEALARVGIDITGARSKPVGEFLGQRFDYVITVCDKARATCPVFPGAARRSTGASRIRSRSKGPMRNVAPPSTRPYGSLPCASTPSCPSR